MSSGTPVAGQDSTFSITAKSAVNNCASTVYLKDSQHADVVSIPPDQQNPGFGSSIYMSLTFNHNEAVLQD